MLSRSSPDPLQKKTCQFLILASICTLHFSQKILIPRFSIKAIICPIAKPILIKRLQTLKMLQTTSPSVQFRHNMTRRSKNVMRLPRVQKQSTQQANRRFLAQRSNPALRKRRWQSRLSMPIRKLGVNSKVRDSSQDLKMVRQRNWHIPACYRYLQNRLKKCKSGTLRKRRTYCTSSANTQAATLSSTRAPVSWSTTGAMLTCVHFSVPTVPCPSLSQERSPDTSKFSTK